MCLARTELDFAYS